MASLKHHKFSYSGVVLLLLLLSNLTTAFRLPFYNNKPSKSSPTTIQYPEQPKHYRQAHIKRQFVNVNISTTTTIQTSSSLESSTTQQQIQTTIDTSFLSSISALASNTPSSSTVELASTTAVQSSVNTPQTTIDVSFVLPSSLDSSSEVSATPTDATDSTTRESSTSDILSEINSAFSGILSSISLAPSSSSMFKLF